MAKTSNILDPIQKELDQSTFKKTDPRNRVTKFITNLYHRWLKREFGMENPEEFVDLYLTGSLTTYQYSDTSDADVSVFPNYEKFQEEYGMDSKAVRQALIAMSIDHIDGTFLPATTHPLQFFVVMPGIRPAEMYQEGLRSAFSLDDKVWIVEPEKSRVHNVKEEYPLIFQRASAMAEKMNQMLDYFPEKARDLWHQIHLKRTLDQQAGLGDFSEGNIVYKWLLHEGVFDRIRGELGEYIAKTSVAGQREVRWGWDKNTNKFIIVKSNQWPMITHPDMLEEFMGEDYEDATHGYFENGESGYYFGYAQLDETMRYVEELQPLSIDYDPAETFTEDDYLRVTNAIEEHIAKNPKISAERSKYPRTRHLPWSKGITEDDMIHETVDHFAGKEVVITEKLDGENTTITSEYTHARSLDTGYHPTRTLVNKLQGEIGYQIPEGWKIIGENMQGKHSIEYSMPSAFFVFAVVDEHGTMLSWDDTEMIAKELGLPTAPVLFRGPFDEATIQGLTPEPSFSSEIEGYVVRNAEAFSVDAFDDNVAKFVREDHVQTDDHWLQNFDYNKISFDLPWKKKKRFELPPEVTFAPMDYLIPQEFDIHYPKGYRWGIDPRTGKLYVWKADRYHLEWLGDLGYPYDTIFEGGAMGLNPNGFEIAHYHGMNTIDPTAIDQLKDWLQQSGQFKQAAQGFSKEQIETIALMLKRNQGDPADVKGLLESSGWSEEAIDTIIEQASRLYQQQEQEATRQQEDVRRMLDNQPKFLQKYRWGWYKGQLKIDDDGGEIHYDMLRDFGIEDDLWGDNEDYEDQQSLDSVEDLYLGYADYFSDGSVDVDPYSYDYGGHAMLPAKVEQEITEGIRQVHMRRFAWNEDERYVDAEDFGLGTQFPYPRKLIEQLRYTRRCPACKGRLLDGEDNLLECEACSWMETMPPRVGATKMQVIYDYEEDRIILGTSAATIPHTKIIGEYDGTDVTLFDSAKFWFNANYFRRLWSFTFPARKLDNVKFKQGVDGEEQVLPTRAPKKNQWKKKNSGVAYDDHITYEEAVIYVGPPFNEMIKGGSEHSELVYEFVNDNDLQMQDMYEAANPIEKAEFYKQYPDGETPDGETYPDPFDVIAWVSEHVPMSFGHIGSYIDESTRETRYVYVIYSGYIGQDEDPALVQKMVSGLKKEYPKIQEWDEVYHGHDGSWYGAGW